MPTFVEELYLVDDFAPVEDRLQALGAADLGEHVSLHYCAHVESGSLKVVKRETGWDITEMAEEDGQFEVVSQKSIGNKDEGFAVLRERGFNEVEVVEMNYHEYDLKGGIVGLYVLNKLIKSVVIDYPEGEHVEIKKELLLDDAQKINMSFSVLLRDTDARVVIQL